MAGYGFDPDINLTDEERQEMYGTADLARRIAEAETTETDWENPYNYYDAFYNTKKEDGTNANYYLSETYKLALNKITEEAEKYGAMETKLKNALAAARYDDVAQKQIWILLNTTEDYKTKTSYSSPIYIKFEYPIHYQYNTEYNSQTLSMKIGEDYGNSNTFEFEVFGAKARVDTNNNVIDYYYKIKLRLPKDDVHENITANNLNTMTELKNVWISSNHNQSMSMYVYADESVDYNDKITFDPYDNLGHFKKVTDGIVLEGTVTVSGGAPTPTPDPDDDAGEPEREQYQMNAITKEAMDAFVSNFWEDDRGYYEDLYWWKDQVFSAKSFESIVGLPVQFMSNVDMRYGSSTFGRQFTEKILYDAPLAIIHPGSPALNEANGDDEDMVNNDMKTVVDSVMKAYSYIGAVTSGESEKLLEKLITDFVAGNYSRFYGLRSEYSRYIQYVNTLDHLFTSYLGISDQYIPGTNTKYRNYDDTIEKIEKTDSGLGLKMIAGNYPALFVYYQPDSSISQSFSNSTRESSLASKIKEVSDYAKEFAFFLGGMGISKNAGVTVSNEIDVGSIYGAGSALSGNNLISRMFGRAAEGVGTIIAGNNLQLPEIYSDSTTQGSDYTLNIKLVNPYGTPEGAFLFQLRQLARLLAISLPRQFGPNGYTAPFIVRAFSKGQFNVQLGIVESLSIRRGGSGGENQTVHDIPMELEVSMTIKDLYQQITISNEFSQGVNPLNLGHLKLLFNNIGLLDFVASYAGYNMNSPDTDKTLDMLFDYIKDSMYNNLQDIGLTSENLQKIVTGRAREMNLPRFKRAYYDSFKTAVADKASWLAR